MCGTPATFVTPLPRIVAVEAGIDDRSRRQHDPAAGREVGVEHRQPVAVVQRQRRDGSVLRVETEVIGDRRALLIRLACERRTSFGAAGRPRRAEQQGEVGMERTWGPLATLDVDAVVADVDRRVRRARRWRVHRCGRPPSSGTWPACSRARYVVTNSTLFVASMATSDRCGSARAAARSATPPAARRRDAAIAIDERDGIETTRSEKRSGDSFLSHDRHDRRV